jgi:glycosyltransferase involved in cell wall biosynthesis
VKPGHLRVCIDARLTSGYGGVEQAVIGLAAGLCQLDDGDDEYLFLVNRGEEDWLTPYLSGPSSVLYARQPPRHMRPPGRLRSAVARRAPFVQTAWHKIPPLPGSLPRELPRSDGTIENAGVDVVHFPFPMAFVTEVPSVYQPTDLLHRHYPEMVGARGTRLRDFTYRGFCAQTTLVVMQTSWGRRDLISHYGVPEEKVVVVPGGSVLSQYPDATPGDLRALRERLSLPDSFVFYPAHTWPQKNHVRLLEALALLRDRDGVVVPLVCSGSLNNFFGPIERAVRELRLSDQVRFLGFVNPHDLRCLYELSTAMVFPSKHEGWGLPLSEAMASGTPIACSTAAGVPDVVGDAALLFDPDSSEEMAAAIDRLWRNPSLRAEVARRGERRAELLSLDRMALVFRAHYRRLAGRPLTPADHEAIAAPPPV